MSTFTAETLAIMEQLPEADQQLALNLVRQVLNAWLIDNELPNQETIAALREGEDILKHPENYPSYASFEDLLREVANEP